MGKYFDRTIAGQLSTAGDEIMKYMGGHLRSELPKGAVVNVTRAARADGVYRGEIIFTSADGRVYRKRILEVPCQHFFQTAGHRIRRLAKLSLPIRIRSQVLMEDLLENLAAE